MCMGYVSIIIVSSSGVHNWQESGSGAHYPMHTSESLAQVSDRVAL